VLAILEEGKKPAEVPVTIPDYKYRLLLNKRTMFLQGFGDINPNIIFLIENGEVVSSSQQSKGKHNVTTT